MQLKLYAAEDERNDARAACARFRNVLEQIRTISDYPGDGKSDFARLARIRKRVNQVASYALETISYAYPET